LSAAPLTILSPVTGTVVELADVDDPVFSAGLVGPGLAITPDLAEGGLVSAPISGTIAKLHPHAFVITHESGQAVLVHLGINTVQLGGDGFTLHVAQGDVVHRGATLITWDPAAIEAGGRSAVCPVVALEGKVDDVTPLAEIGTWVARGEDLLIWE
jgi:sugar PTS system EIIA component